MKEESENVWKAGLEKRLETAPYLGGNEPNEEDRHNYMLMNAVFDKAGNMKYKPVTAESHPSMHKWMKAMSPKEWTMSATISPDDFRSIVKEMFDAADANHDEVLELDEFKQFSLYLLQSMNGLSLAESQESIE